MSQIWKKELEETGMRLLSLVLPPVCVACHRIEGIIALNLGLCSECTSGLRPTPRTVCTGCSKPLAVDDPLPVGYHCSACRRDPPPFECLYSGWAYEPPLVEVIHALKFQRLSFLGADLGRALSHRYRCLIEDVDLVVPVPLHWRRQVSRGFNQAEEIARPVANGLELPLVRALRRRSATPPQAALNRPSRERNLRRAFITTRAGLQRVRESRVLLVDDVVTTRNTLAAATQCLLKSGANSVICLTGGRTPEPI